MKQLLFAWCLFALLGPVLRAQSLSAEDRTEGLNYLNKTRAQFLAATKGLSEAQWNFKQAPDRWSVAEVAEHIAAAEDFLRDMIQDKVMKAPAPTEAVDVHQVDQWILKTIPDRSKKAQAPEPLRPNNRFGSPKKSL